MCCIIPLVVLVRNSAFVCTEIWICSLPPLSLRSQLVLKLRYMYEATLHSPSYLPPYHALTISIATRRRNIVNNAKTFTIPIAT